MTVKMYGGIPADRLDPHIREALEKGEAEEARVREESRRAERQAVRNRQAREDAEDQAKRDAARDIREAEQAAAEASLRSILYAAYMDNPAAGEADFERDYPDLRRQVLIRGALSGSNRELEIMRQRHRSF